MDVEQALIISTKFNTIKKNVAAKTLNVFRDLKYLYSEQLWKHGVELSSGSTQSNFVLDGRHFTLLIVEGCALAREMEQDISVSSVERITKDHSLFAGCIALTVKLESMNATVMRIFVNSSGEIACEFGMGQRHPFDFLRYESIKSQAEVFFHTPIVQALLNVEESWKLLQEVKMISNIRDLKVTNEQIGFNG